MREDHSEMMVAQARGGLTGGINRANARDSKNTRDREAEMRRRRLAKNALLAVRAACVAWKHKHLTRSKQRAAVLEGDEKTWPNI